jgi:pimeloyl-ACP methyl ester carboxylesterase
METVISADGTTIAFERTGDGPPLVLLHGTGRDRSYWSHLLPELSSFMTVHTVERRGRGHSGDADRYDLDREVEDVLAVINAAVEPVHLLGHSYGAILSLEAALRTDRIRSLTLYEPPFSAGKERVPDDLADRLEALLTAGDPEAVLVTFLQEGPRYPPEEIRAQRERPDWAYRVSFAHTLPRETRTSQEYVFDRGRFAELRLPTLLLLGSESPTFFQQAIEALHMALPRSEVVVLQGQHHNAVEEAPGLFAGEVLRFLRAQTTTGHE